MPIRRALPWLSLLLAGPTALRAQEYKVEPLKEAPPAALSAAIRATLAPEGLRVLNDQGKPYADLWLRKDAPASSKPSGPQGSVLLPFLADGELIGALRFSGEGHDYRDQTIAGGIYTLRHGLHPVDGNHQGVSLFRDFALLLPAAKDTKADDLPRKALETTSSEAAGTTHPAILPLLPAEAGQAGIVRDQEKDTWAAVLPLSLKVKGESAATTAPVLLVVVGTSPL